MKNLDNLINLVFGGDLYLEYLLVVPGLVWNLLEELLAPEDLLLELLGVGVLHQNWVSPSVIPQVVYSFLNLVFLHIILVSKLDLISNEDRRVALQLIDFVLLVGREHLQQFLPLVLPDEESGVVEAKRRDIFNVGGFIEVLHRNVQNVPPLPLPELRSAVDGVLDDSLLDVHLLLLEPGDHVRSEVGHPHVVLLD